MGATVERVAEGRGVGSKIRWFYAMKLMLTGNDSERISLPARSRSAKTRYLTAAAFF